MRLLPVRWTAWERVVVVVVNIALGVPTFDCLGVATKLTLGMSSPMA
jgi:hypothetical protein